MDMVKGNYINHPKKTQNDKHNNQTKMATSPFHYDLHNEDMSSLYGKHHKFASSRPFSAGRLGLVSSGHDGRTLSVLLAARWHCMICISSEAL